MVLTYVFPGARRDFQIDAQERRAQLGYEFLDGVPSVAHLLRPKPPSSSASGWLKPGTGGAARPSHRPALRRVGTGLNENRGSEDPPHDGVQTRPTPCSGFGGRLAAGARANENAVMPVVESRVSVCGGADMMRPEEDGP